jgi:hypothetical protein
MVDQKDPDGVLVESEIIQVDFRDPKPSITKKKKETRCRHGTFEVDEDAQQVYCGGCGAEMAAFKIVSMIANEWGRYYATAKQLRSEAERRRVEIGDLERQRKNLKARISRLKRDPMHKTSGLLKEMRMILVWAIEKRDQCGCRPGGPFRCKSHDLLDRVDAEIEKGEH